MKTTSTLLLAPLFYSILIVGAAYAADQSPPDAPPKINIPDEGESAVTQRKNEMPNQTTKTIQNGEQTEIRVTNKVGTYIVKPNQSVGTSLPGDAQSSSNHAVPWIVKGWRGSRETKANVAPGLQANPAIPDTPTVTNSK